MAPCHGCVVGVMAGPCYCMFFSARPNAVHPTLTRCRPHARPHSTAWRTAAQVLAGALLMAPALGARSDARH